MVGETDREKQLQEELTAVRNRLKENEDYVQMLRDEVCDLQMKIEDLEWLNERLTNG